MAYGSKDIKELLREAKIGGWHGVKRKSCEVHRAYCVTGMPNSSWHLAMLQRNTCTFSKVTGRPSSANTAYVSSPLQSTTPGQQVGRTSLGAPFQVFLLSCILGLVLPSSYNVAVMRVRVHVSNLHLDKNKWWLNLTSLFGKLRVVAHMSKSYYHCSTLHPQACPPAHPQSQPLVTSNPGFSTRKNCSKGSWWPIAGVWGTIAMTACIIIMSIKWRALSLLCSHEYSVFKDKWSSSLCGIKYSETKATAFSLPLWVRSIKKYTSAMQISLFIRI